MEFDSDGYTVDDCDDENPDVYPGADSCVISLITIAREH